MFLFHKFFMQNTQKIILFMGVEQNNFNRYKRICTKVDASIFDSALSHPRRSDASEKKRKYSRPLLSVFACGKVSIPRLYRLTIILLKSLKLFITSRKIPNSSKTSR